FFGAGVLLDPNMPGLIDIPISHTGMPETRIVEDFDISTNGSATMVLTSTFEGRDADFIRQGRAVMNQDSIEDSLLTLYKKNYGGVVATALPVTQDDESLDRIQVTRRYYIENIWKPTLQTNRIACEFISRGIFDRLYLPAK